MIWECGKPSFSGLYCSALRRLCRRIAFGCGPIRIGGPGVVGMRSPGRRPLRSAGRPAPTASPTSSAAFVSSASSERAPRTTRSSSREEMNSATPVTMVIRTVRPIRPFDYSGRYANGFLHVRVDVAEQQRAALDRVRVRAAGTARQGRASSATASPSTSGARTAATSRPTVFAEYSRAFEPYDRLLFREGKVDHWRRRRSTS